MTHNDSGQNGVAHKPGNAHDKFFRSFFSNADKVRNLFKLAFSEQQLAHFDLNTISIQPNDWLEIDSLREQRADLVVSVRLKSGEDLSIYVLTEHKSQPDPRLMLQLLSYQTQLYVQHDAAAVLPVVVYHGKKQSWPGSLSFMHSRKLPDGFVEDFSDLMLSYGVSLVNLRDPKFRDRFDELDRDVELGLEFMADIWEADEASFARLIKRTVELSDDKRKNLGTKAAQYLIIFKPEITIKNMNQEIKKQLPGDKAMEAIAKEWSMLTKEQIMESCRQEGLQEGRQEGLQEGLQEGYANARQDEIERLANKGLSDSQISEFTDLTLDEIKQMKNGDNSAG